MDALFLSRLQFVFTVAVHYIFPPVSIGIAFLIVLLEGKFLRTGNEVFKKAVHFWLQLFGLLFAFGVVTGVVLAFQFGTNWGAFTKVGGDIIASPLVSEALFAFLLESTALGIMVYGWNKLNHKIHFASSILLFIGTLLSAFWIVTVNSWMQTPAGVELDTAKTITTATGAEVPKAVLTDFWAMVWNPSTISRFIHVVLSALITGAFMMLGISAYIVRKEGKTRDEIGVAFKTALWVGLVCMVLQLFSGHDSARYVSEHQPLKMAAIEGHFEEEPLDLYLLGWVNVEDQTTTGLKIPGGGSFLLSADFNKPHQGLASVEKSERPWSLQMIFQAYHAMISFGMMMLLLLIIAVFKLKKGTLFETKWLLGLFVLFIFVPHIVNIAGWVVAEMGRQPWLVYNVLKIKDGLSVGLTGGEVLTSLIGFILFYGLGIVLFIYVFKEKIVSQIKK